MHNVVLYLDTNHVSELARCPTATDQAAVLGLLQSGRGRLAISLVHFIELAAPDFRSVDDARGLLRDVPVAWTVSTEELWDGEIAVACARARGLERQPPRVFCENSLDWSRWPSPASGNAAEFLDSLIEQPALRDGLLQVADEWARASMLKTEAALIKVPGLPLELAVDAHLAGWRERNAHYADGLNATEIVRAVGGSVGFPSLNMFHRTIEQRLRQVSQKSTRNDIFDDYHAAYAPYAAVTALDRGLRRGYGVPDLPSSTG